MPAATHWIWMAIAGAAGVLLRALVSLTTSRVAGDGFPWGVVIVNVSGSLAFGILVAATPLRLLPPGSEKIILVGFLGGFTTFSSFSYDTVRLAQTGHLASAVAFVAINNVGGIAAAWLGLSGITGRTP
jgi:CrcB protein